MLVPPTPGEDRCMEEEGTAVEKGSQVRSQREEEAWRLGGLRNVSTGIAMLHCFEISLLF